jgi:hypothetical protein
MKRTEQPRPCVTNEPYAVLRSAGRTVSWEAGMYNRRASRKPGIKKLSLDVFWHKVKEIEPHAARYLRNE